jgi:flagellar motor switch protein FliN
MKTASESSSVPASGIRLADRPTGTSVVANQANFPQLDAIANAAAAGTFNHLLEVSVCLTAELGRVTLSIGDIMKLGPGSVVGLNRTIAEPVDLLVQGVPFARGEVVVIDDRFAIRIREIVDPAQQA